jgi:hypothetical protein
MATKQTAGQPVEETPVTRSPKQSAAENEPKPAVEAKPVLAASERSSSVVRETAEPRDNADMETEKRRMPDNLRRFLIRLQGGKYYLPAAYRIVWFRDEMGDEWGIRTQLIEGGHEKGFATVHAEIVDPQGRVVASGHKTESKGDFPAGWVEKAESGSIARALAVLGFGTQFMPELDDDGNHPADSPREMAYPAPRVEQAVSPRANPAADGQRGPDRAVHEGSTPQAARPPVPASEIWEGPGQCPRCHAPEGKRHGKPCIA